MEPSELSELKPCPFCGGTEVKMANAGFNHTAIRCQNDKCNAQGLRDYDPIKAIEAWNRRPNEIQS